jgi:hypothetical protein
MWYLGCREDSKNLHVRHRGHPARTYLRFDLIDAAFLKANWPYSVASSPVIFAVGLL